MRCAPVQHQCGLHHIPDLYNIYIITSNLVTGEIYVNLLKDEIAPAVREVYPIGDALWQDDPARIHRSQVALGAVSLNFR